MINIGTRGRDLGIGVGLPVFTTNSRIHLCDSSTSLRNNLGVIGVGGGRAVRLVVPYGNNVVIARGWGVKISCGGDKFFHSFYFVFLLVLVRAAAFVNDWLVWAG